MAEAVLTLSEAPDRAKAREPIAPFTKSNGLMRRAPNAVRLHTVSTGPKPLPLQRIPVPCRSPPITPRAS
jgi:hypothetical protein